MKARRDISQIDVVTGIMDVLTKVGVKNVEPRLLNACIAGANLIVAELHRDSVMASPGMGLAAWLASDDTGISSRYMARVLCGAACKHEPGYPLDPDDFGRCYRFLLAVPEARASLDKMANKSPVWAEYVRNWAEMERLYLEELPAKRLPKLYKLMQRLQNKAKVA